MEEGLFQRPAVRREHARRFVEARLHTDHETLGQEWTELQRRMIGQTGNPWFAIVDPATGAVLRKSSYTDDEATWLRFLRGE